MAKAHIQHPDDKSALPKALCGVQMPLHHTMWGLDSCERCAASERKLAEIRNSFARVRRGYVCIESYNSKWRMTYCSEDQQIFVRKEYATLLAASKARDRLFKKHGKVFQVTS